MKSGKQRREEIQRRRAQRKAKEAAALSAAKAAKKRTPRPTAAVAVNVDALAPYNSYGHPLFVERGFYVDVPFTCAGCGKEEVWTARQQQWWYEVAKGQVFSTANRCRACRRRERERSAAARRVHLEGLARKRRSQL